MDQGASASGKVSVVFLHLSAMFSCVSLVNTPIFTAVPPNRGMFFACNYLTAISAVELFAMFVLPNVYSTV